MRLEDKEIVLNKQDKVSITKKEINPQDKVSISKKEINSQDKVSINKKETNSQDKVSITKKEVTTQDNSSINRRDTIMPTYATSSLSLKDGKNAIISIMCLFSSVVVYIYIKYCLPAYEPKGMYRLTEIVLYLLGFGALCLSEDLDANIYMNKLAKFLYISSVGVILLKILCLLIILII